MNATAAGAGPATVTGQPEARQLRRSSDEMLAVVAAGAALAKPWPESNST